MSGILVVDMREVEKLQDGLKTFASKAVPFAQRESLNRTAFAFRRVWGSEMERVLVLRNTWTARTVQVVKAQGSNVSAMEARVGSTERYLAKQESGGFKSKKGKHGVAIPTRVASGEGRGGGVRRRLVRSGNQLRAISLPSTVGGTRKQRNAIAIRKAKASGRKFAFLDLPNKKGLFRISGGKRSSRIDMLWETSRSRVRIPPHRTLEPALRRIEPHLPAIHLGVLREQARRYRLFGY